MTTEKKAKKVKARVLSNCQYGKINEIVELDERQAKSGVEAGLLDTHPKAIKG